VFPFRYCI